MKALSLESVAGYCSGVGVIGISFGIETEPSSEARVIAVIVEPLSGVAANGAASARHPNLAGDEVSKDLGGAVAKADFGARQRTGLCCLRSAWRHGHAAGFDRMRVGERAEGAFDSSWKVLVVHVLGSRKAD